MTRARLGAIALATIGMGVPAASCASQVGPTTSELLILQSSTDPLALKAPTRNTRWPDLKIMASDDCPELKPGLYVLASRAGARGGAAQAKAAGTADAYVRKCTAKPGSLAQRGIPAVDPSFAAMRGAPINFTGEDAVTRVQDGLLIRPWYQPTPEDPREGLRVAVEDLSRGRRVIVQDCGYPEVAHAAGHIAIACAAEQIAEQPVYRTTLYRASDLTKLRDIARCRRPALRGDAVQCTRQTPGSDGQIGESAYSERL